MKKTGFVAERLHLTLPAGVIDRAKGLVRGVRLINNRSRNGRFYPADVLAKYAALYDGVGVNVGHHFNPATGVPTEVPPWDRFGRLENPVAVNGGLNADLRFNPEHKFAKTFLWAVENDPGQFCFSPLHRVTWAPGRNADGELVAEEVLEVASVDIVSDGGTTDGVFESLRAGWRIPDPPAVNPNVERMNALMARLALGTPDTSTPAYTPRSQTVSEMVSGFRPDEYRRG